MNTHDWALVAFTILAQMSVGSFVVLGIAHFFTARSTSVEEADRLSDRALLAIGPVMVLGLIASFFHLGTPLNAYNAIGNLGSSWLSREIFCGVAFTAFGAIFAFMQWRKVGTPSLRTAIAAVAALVGLALVYSMSNVYLLRTVPVWDTLLTPVSFFVTTFLLGSLAMGAAFVANYMYVQRKNPGCADAQCTLMRSSLRWIGIASIVLLGIEFVVLPMYLTYLSSDTTVVAGELFVNSFGVVLVARLVLVFLGAGLFGALVYRNAISVGREKIMGTLAYAAFALVLISEILGRFLFYASHTGFKL
ncbi:MAG: dimethyl sulfoxide reductase anchor subunit [Anaerolineae bacterium]|nr:dimethyl sulfoxide reductase anchor subunit [Anaerolineae bacterium]